MISEQFSWEKRSRLGKTKCADLVLPQEGWFSCGFLLVLPQKGFLWISFSFITGS